ncbi:MAG: ABC transporter ATP-binding protein/permease [Arcicella sp.]|nr:ABC transporter ATP-binding protein/permease [Arcicella sp.]
MKTYLRILGFAPIKRYFLPFLIASILSSIFGILNFTLIQPLLEVLFTKNAVQIVPKPSGSFSIEYFVSLFNHYLTKVAVEKGKIQALWFVAGVILGSVFLANFFKYLSALVIENFKGKTVLNIRQAVFEKTLHLHLGFFSNERKGNLISHITTDVQEIENSVGRAFSAIFKEVFTFVSFFFALFYQSTQLTLFSLIVIPLAGLLITTVNKKLLQDAQEVQQRQSNLFTVLDETLGGMRVVKGFNAEKFIKNRFHSENQGYFSSWLRMSYRQQAQIPLTEFMGVLTVTGILIFGGSLVLSGNSTMSASGFLTYIILFSQVTRPAKEIANAVSGIQRGVAAAERIFGVLDFQNNITDKKQAIEIQELAQEIEFKSVSFEYEEGTKVLDDISFTIAKGKTVALVGSSGGGKSTIADLVPRFYDPTEGHIFIDGKNLKDLSQQSLRNLMGIVTQESILFNDTIANNIAFGTQHSEREIIEAAKIANAHQFITETSEGYETLIGDRGGKLSGGQRQRLSIARAILKNPPILILDEATSALDTESEKLVQEALANLMKNRTTLVIAHRLSTIQNADEILVIHQGKIIERGTHESLLQIEDGFYRKLSTMQG